MGEQVTDGSGGQQAALPPPLRYVVQISADAEWRAMRRIVTGAEVFSSPLGEWFTQRLGTPSHDVLFFHGGWGKIAAAASTQFLINQCTPTFLINLGTCGGFLGEIDHQTIVLVERTVVYDIFEQMGGADAALQHYSTELDLGWLAEPLPHAVERTLMVSADRDLKSDELESLKQRYNAVVGDWESGSIAWVASRNGVRTLILRGVSDLVGDTSGEAYDNHGLFEDRALSIMTTLLNQLPNWIDHLESGSDPTS